MRTALYVLLALATVPAFAGQTVWKWVDEKGVTHFSDQPVPGATKMELNSAPRPADPPSVSTPPSDSDTPTTRGPAYSRFVVASPQPDEAVINTGGKVTVSLAATPALAADHMVTVYLNGARVEDFPPDAMSHELSNVPRGTHTLKAVVTTKQGAPVQESRPVTFHVRQTSVAQPPVGPALRNPPKPRRSAGNKMRTTQPSYAALNGGAAQIDPKTNLPVKTQPAPAGPKK